VAENGHLWQAGEAPGLQPPRDRRWFVRTVSRALWLLLSFLPVTPVLAWGWVDRSAGLLPRSIHALAVAPDRWLAGGEGRLFESTDRGRSWRLVFSVRSRRPGPQEAERAQGLPSSGRGFLARAERAFRGLRARHQEPHTKARPPDEESAPHGRAEVDRFRAVAIASHLSCGGAERGLWCSVRRGPYRRYPLPRGAAVHCLLADPGGETRILVGGSAGLHAVEADGSLRTLGRDAEVRLLTAAGRRVYAASAQGLAVLGASGLMRVLDGVWGLGHEGSTLSRRRGAPFKALAGHPRDLYAATPDAIARLERGAWRPLPMPPGGSIESLHLCGSRLAALNRDGVWVLDPLGWKNLPPALPARSLACSEGSLLVATAGGVWEESRERDGVGLSQGLDAGRLRQWLGRMESLPSWLAPRRLESRARLASWFPRLAVVARVLSLRDVRSPVTVIDGVLHDAPIYWRGDSILRARGQDRFELMVSMRWPLGSRSAERDRVAALRAQRSLERRRQRLLQEAVALWRALIRLRRDSEGPLRRVLRRRLRTAEITALLEGLLEGPVKERS
jgi:hypothetical protein